VAHGPATKWQTLDDEFGIGKRCLYHPTMPKPSDGW
jgi:hypothetical protein